MPTAIPAGLPKDISALKALIFLFLNTAEETWVTGSATDLNLKLYAVVVPLNWPTLLLLQLKFLFLQSRSHITLIPKYVNVSNFLIKFLLQNN